MYFFLDIFYSVLWYKNYDIGIWYIASYIRLSCCISALEPDGSWADIQQAQANIGCDTLYKNCHM